MSKLKVRRSRVVVAGAGVFLSAATFFGIVVFRHDVARSPASAVVVRVTVYFPGMSAQDIERDITVPLEDQVTQVQGVGKVESVTSEGRSTVSCEFRPGADGLGAAEKVRSKVRRVQVAAGAEAPVVASRSDSESIISYVVLSVQGVRITDLAVFGHTDLESTQFRQPSEQFDLHAL